MIKGVARKYFESKSCVFCGSYSLSRLGDKRIKCNKFKREYSLLKLKRDLQILYYFYLELSTRKTAKELNIDYQTVQSRFMKFRKNIFVYSEQQSKNLNTQHYIVLQSKTNNNGHN